MLKYKNQLNKHKLNTINNKRLINEKKKKKMGKHNTKKNYVK